VEEDERLEELLQCPCKFLITTRKDFRDYNYKQININRIHDTNELKMLFSTYNEEVYSELEEQWIEKLIEFVDGHTMTVELISKYLRNSGCMPSVLYERFMEKSGITNTEEYVVKQRKDRKMNSETVNNHLSILFDVFNFEKNAKEIISSLSLFAGIRILKERFTALCNVENISNELNVLIRNGWIEYNDSTEKISLHQVIQDLIFSKLNPTTQNCPHIVEGMLRYIKEDTGNSYERGARKKVFDVFAKRITGTDVLYAKVCLAYGTVNKVEEAIEICLTQEHPDKNEVLAGLYMKKIEYLCQCDDMLVADEELKEYGRKTAQKIAELFRRAVECCQGFPLELRMSRYVELGGELDKILMDSMFTVYFDDVEELDLIYNQIEELYEIATQKLPEINVGSDEKEHYLYAVMRDFYSDQNQPMAPYRYEHYGNLDKAYQYQTILDDIRKNSDVGEPDESSIRLWVADVTKQTMADKYAEEGNYELAIEFYRKAYEEEDFLKDMMVEYIAHIYFKTGEVDKAIGCLKQSLEYDKKCIADGKNGGWYSASNCIELIQILIEQGMHQEAVGYANELIAYMQEKRDEEDYGYALSHVIMAHYYLYQMEQQETEKEQLWKMCEELFSKLHSDELEKVLHPFLEEYICREQPTYKRVLWLINGVDRFDQCPEYKEKLVRMVIQNNQYVKGSIFIQVELLLKLLESKCMRFKSSFTSACELLNEIEALLRKYQIVDVYLQNKYLQLKTDIMFWQHMMGKSRVYTETPEHIQEIQKTINYLVIAEHEVECCDDKRAQMGIWSRTAGECEEVKKYEEKIVCLKKQYDIFMSLHDCTKEVDDYEAYSFEEDRWDILRELAWTYIQTKDYEQAGLILEDLYRKQIELLICSEEKGKNDYFSEFSEGAEKACYSERIKDIGWLFELAQMDENQFLSYLTALYMLVVPMPENDILHGLLEKQADVDLVCDKIMLALRDINPKQVEEVISLKAGLGKCEEFVEVYKEKLSPILGYISKNYENREVEFK